MAAGHYARPVETVSRFVRRLMSTGLLRAGWYSILTGVALLYISYLLGSASADAAAMPVAVALAVTGVWQLEQGLRAESRRRLESTDEPL